MILCALSLDRTAGGFRECARPQLLRRYGGKQSGGLHRAADQFALGVSRSPRSTSARVRRDTLLPRQSPWYGFALCCHMICFEWCINVACFTFRQILLANSKFSSVMYSLTSYGISFSTRSAFIVFIVYMYGIFESYVWYALWSGRSCNEKSERFAFHFRIFEYPHCPALNC
jgi:hypothetical protein